MKMCSETQGSYWHLGHPRWNVNVSRLLHMKLHKQNHAEPQKSIMCQFSLSKGLDLTQCVLKGMEVSCFCRDVLHLSGWGCCNLLRWDTAYCQSFICLGILDIPSLAKPYFLLAGSKSNNCYVVLITNIKSMSDFTASFTSSMSW